MRSTRQQARYAGLLYILMCVTGLPGLLLIPKALIVHGDAVATANHLRTSSTLFRLGIASELFHQVVFAYLALALYDLFRSVNRSAATQLVLLVAMSVPIMFLDTLNEFAALILVGAPPFLATFTRPQLDSLAYLFLRLHGEGIGVVDVFWSLWLVPFGLLVMRSGFLPRALVERHEERGRVVVAAELVPRMGERRRHRTSRRSRPAKNTSARNERLQIPVPVGGFDFDRDYRALFEHAPENVFAVKATWWVGL